MRRRTCTELGLCQVEAALAFDRPCPQPCAECELRVTPLVAEGSTVAVEVSQRVHPAAAGYPFAPGAIETFRRRRTRARRAVAAGVVLAVVCAAAGLLAGYARAKGWL